MSGNYARIIHENLKRLHAESPSDIAAKIGAERKGDAFTLQAFGASCRISPEGILLNDEILDGPLGVIISLYLLHASHENRIIDPLRAFKEFPDSMPYAGAFVTHTESVLVPHVEKIDGAQDRIFKVMGCETPAVSVNGDFSLIVSPLPKIALVYIFYRADEDFSASVTCLYSNNANHFISIDGLADIGEYTSKKIIEIVA